MTDYGEFSREQLIERVRVLEARTASDVAQTAERATERKRLEKEVLEISERERQSVGQTLHDGLCQHLAGIELMSRVLEQNLAKKSKPGAAQAGKIAEHVRAAISQTRMVARGLSPVS